MRVFHSSRRRALWKSRSCSEVVSYGSVDKGTPPLRIAWPDTRCPRIELRAAECTCVQNESLDVVWNRAKMTLLKAFPEAKPPAQIST
jgi:hypothetical protein